jgi:hypothetical protein
VTSSWPASACRQPKHRTLCWLVSLSGRGDLQAFAFVRRVVASLVVPFSVPFFYLVLPAYDSDTVKPGQ